MHLTEMCSKLLLSLVVTVCLVGSLNIFVSGDDKARFDNFRLYQVHLKTSEHIAVFQELEKHGESYRFNKWPQSIDQKLNIIVASQKIAEITDVLLRYSVPFEILSYNFQEKIDAQFRSVKPADVVVDEFDWEHYFHLKAIYTWLDYLAARYPNNVTILDLGSTAKGLPIKGIKISNKANNTAVLVDAGIHPLEWISTATATFILNELLTSQNGTIKEMADNWDWIIFPILNPDGYKTTFEEDRLWPKNRQAYGVCAGADLNRNWDIDWNKTFGSSDSCSRNYPGARPFSEPETAAVSKFLSEQVRASHIRTYISLHAFGQEIIIANGPNGRRPHNYDDLLAIGLKGADAFKNRYDSEYRVYGGGEYPVSGRSMDWIYGKLNVPLAYTIELRGTANSTDMYMLPASQIAPTGLETLDALKAMLHEGRNRGYYNYTELIINQSSGAANIFGICWRNHLYVYASAVILISQVIKEYA